MSDQQPSEDSTGESKLWGVSIRSWAASFVISSCTLTICWIALTDQDPQWVMVLASSAISFLFGKAAGAARQ